MDNKPTMMSCPFCQTENPDVARFCMQCGQPLRHCSRCQTILPQQANYCYHCGLPQSKQGEQVTRSKTKRSPSAILRQYMSPEYAAKLESATQATSHIKSERRVVTILFCDVKGSTAMAEKLDPEEWSEVMNGAFEYLIEPIYRYEGTVVRLLGDAVLAFFGAPISHEDDPQRAVLAGLAMTEGIQKYRQQIEKQRNLAFDVRIGINTGLVVVGEIGSNLRAEYTVMGDAVNLAARMEQTAQPGTIQISGYTYKLIAPLFKFESLGMIDVKGKTEPVPAYRVVGLQKKPGRLRGIEGLNAPLIGREAELMQLEHILHQVADHGQGHLVCLIGEAGLGKSRLTRELKEAYLDDHLTHVFWSESRALSFESSRPYSQFQQHIRHFFEVNSHDSAEVVHAKIVELLKQQDSKNPTQTEHILETLLGVSLINVEDSNIKEGRFKQELFATVNQAVEERMAQAPIVMVFEDLHWADQASVELLLHLLPLMTTKPLLLLCVMRPDTEAPSWQVKQNAETLFSNHYTEIALSPLSSQDSEELVNQLLVISELPTQLRHLIQEKSEGNPFFLEEVVRTLLNEGVVQRTADGLYWQATRDITDIAIPDNLQSLLMARIDRLAEETKQTLQRASVIGRLFSYELLAAISSDPSLLPEQLNQLAELGMIRQTTTTTEPSYIFHHVLTQEAAYQTILLRHRRALHHQLGHILEDRYATQLESYAPILGHHFYEGGHVEKSGYYYTLAGDIAFQLSATTEAMTHYQRALEIQTQYFDTMSKQEQHDHQHVYLRLGRTFELLNQYEPALQTYQQLENLAETHTDESCLLASLMAQATIRSTFTGVYDVMEAEQLCLRGIMLARKLNDRAAEAKVLWNMMLLERAKQDPIQGIAYGEQSLAIAREHNLTEQLAFTLNDLQFLYMAAGKFEDSRKVLIEAGNLWRQQENLPMLTDNLGNAIILEYMLGDYHEALATSEQAYLLSEMIENQWGQIFSRIMNAAIHYDLGHIDEAITVAEDILQQTKRSNVTPFARVNQLSSLAWIYGNLGLVDKACKMAEQASLEAVQYDTFQTGALTMLAYVNLLNGNLISAQNHLQQIYKMLSPIPLTSFAQHLVAVMSAKLALANESFDEALNSVDEQITKNEALGLRPYLDDLLLIKAEIYMAQHQWDNAHATLLKAKPLAETLPNRRILWQLLAYLSQIHARWGQDSQAKQLQNEAWQIVQYLLNHMPDDLQDSFLQEPLVKALVLHKS